MKKRKTVTLIELIVVIVVTGIITVGLSKYIVQTMNIWDFISTRTDIVSEVRLGLIRLGRDIRLTETIEAVDTDISDDEISLQLVKHGGQRIRYRYNQVNDRVFYEEDTDSDAIFEAGEPSEILLSGVSSFSFQYFKNDGTTTIVAGEVYRINIAVTLLTGGQTIQLNYGIFPGKFKHWLWV